MPVTPTYPGIYIEELPSSSHTITPAPTSTAVFVGYSHPLKTMEWGTAQQIFSFTEYERYFGGLFQSELVDRNLPYAVYQFFLNGGSTAYVVGLQATLFDGATDKGVYVGATAAIPGTNLTLTAREPTDQVAMTVTVTNVRAPNGTDDKLADLQIGYGGTAETLRGIDLSLVGSETATEAGARIAAAITAASSLVSAASTGDPGTFTAGSTTFAFAEDVSTWTAGEDSDYTDVFADDSSLDKVDVFNLLVLPGVTSTAIWPVAHAFAEKKRAFAIMDPPEDYGADASTGLSEIGDYADDELMVSANAAFYFPYLQTTDPLTSEEIPLPPSGFVAGIYARTDTNRGVWKAPAGLETVVKNTLGVVDEGKMTDMRQGVLNPKGVNCLRTFPGVGTVVYGARTTVTANPSFEQWRYIPVRRMALFIEQSLYANLGWVVFEPNAQPLWTAIRTSIERFMLGLFKQGAFFGEKPSEAFLVQCDETTTTQEDIDLGKVNIIVGFRPLKPAEFVIVKITQLAGQAES